MNWSRIKSIMICFLLGMNIFMLAFLAIFTYKENTVPEEVIKSSENILAAKGYEVSCSLPGNYVSLPVLNTKFYTASELSDMFFGRQLPFRTDGNLLIATENNSTLTVSSNSFTYENGKASKEASSGKIKRALKKAGINMYGSVYDENTGFFYKMYKNTNLFNMYIKATLDDNGKLCEVTAQWPKSLSPRANKRFSFVEHVLDIPEAFPSKGSINKIECGYSLRPVGGEKFTFVPAWRVTVNEEMKIFEEK